MTCGTSVPLNSPRSASYPTAPGTRLAVVATHRGLFDSVRSTSSMSCIQRRQNLEEFERLSPLRVQRAARAFGEMTNHPLDKRPLGSRRMYHKYARDAIGAAHAGEIVQIEAGNGRCHHVARAIEHRIVDQREIDVAQYPAAPLGL